MLTLKVTLLYNDLEPSGLSQNGNVFFRGLRSADVEHPLSLYDALLGTIWNNSTISSMDLLLSLMFLRPVTPLTCTVTYVDCISLRGALLLHDLLHIVFGAAFLWVRLDDCAVADDEHTIREKTSSNTQVTTSVESAPGPSGSVKGQGDPSSALWQKW